MASPFQGMQSPFSGLQQGAEQVSQFMAAPYEPRLNQQKMQQSDNALQASSIELEGAQREQELNKALMMGAIAERALDIPEEMRGGYFSTVEQTLGMELPPDRRTDEALRNAADIKKMLSQMRRLEKPSSTVESAIVKDESGNLYSVRTTNRGDTQYSSITPGAPERPLGDVSLVSKGTGMTAEESLRMAGKKARLTTEQKKNVELGYAPRIAEAVQLAKDSAKSLGQEMTDLQKLEASLPGLQDMVSSLKELAPIATATTAGKAWNVLRKELNFKPTQGATARARYEAIIDSEILPLLKQTSGANPTDAEGQRLYNTLGDPDASPQIKAAQLDEFLKSKQRQIQTGRRTVGAMGGGDQDEKIEGFRQKYEALPEAEKRKFIEQAPQEILNKMGLSR